MFRKPSAAVTTALRDFVFRHEIFVDAREFDDGFIFTRNLRYRELLRLVRRHSRTARGRAANRRTKSRQRLRRP